MNIAATEEATPAHAPPTPVFMGPGFRRDD